MLRCSWPCAREPSGPRCCTNVTPTGCWVWSRSHPTFSAIRRRGGDDRVAASRRRSTPMRGGPRRTAPTGSVTGRATFDSSPSGCFPSPSPRRPTTTWSGWGLDTDAETILHDQDSSCALDVMTPEERVELCGSISCPVLVIGGTADEIVMPGRAVRLAEVTGGDLLMVEGGGHVPHARHPVVVNHAIKEFVDRIVPPLPRAHPVAVRAEPHPRGPLGLARRSGWATCCVIWRSRGLSGNGSRTSGSSGGHSLPSRTSSRPPARSSIRSARRWLRRPSTGRARPPTTTCTPSRRSGTWTRSSAPTTCSSTRSSARRRTTSGWGMSPGRSTTSCTRTPSARSRRTSSPPTSSASCRSIRRATRVRSSSRPTTTPR